MSAAAAFFTRVQDDKRSHHIDYYHTPLAAYQNPNISRVSTHLSSAALKNRHVAPAVSCCFVHYIMLLREYVSTRAPSASPAVRLSSPQTTVSSCQCFVVSCGRSRVHKKARSNSAYWSARPLEPYSDQVTHCPTA